MWGTNTQDSMTHSFYFAWCCVCVYLKLRVSVWKKRESGVKYRSSRRERASGSTYQYIFLSSNRFEVRHILVILECRLSHSRSFAEQRPVHNVLLLKSTWHLAVYCICILWKASTNAANWYMALHTEEHIHKSGLSWYWYLMNEKLWVFVQFR